MATSFDSVIDMALIIIRDYKLDALYETSKTDFEAVLDGYVLKAVPKFAVSCLKDLSYDVDNRQFNADLDAIEIDILSDWTVIVWYTDQLQDVLDFKEPLRDTDFNKFASGQNLKPRQSYLDDLRKKVKQDTSNYQFQHISNLPYFDGNN
jgi:hypothetical protein